MLTLPEHTLANRQQSLLLVCAESYKNDKLKVEIYIPTLSLFNTNLMNVIKLFGRLSLQRSELFAITALHSCRYNKNTLFGGVIFTRVYGHLCGYSGQQCTRKICTVSQAVGK